MFKLVANRIVQLVVVVWAVSTLLFVLLRASGDPVLIFCPDCDVATADRLREELGFNAPLPVQYGRYFRDLIVPRIDERGALRVFDFGESLRARRPAMNVVMDNVWNSISLSLVSLALAIAIGIPVGIFAAIKRGTTSVMIMLTALIGQSMPSFWLGILLVLLFAVRLRWLPPFGYGEPKHFIMPAICLAAFPAARLARLMRSALLDVLTQDYVRTAKAKGLRYSLVITRHAVRNAMIPIVTAIGLDIAGLLGGSVIIENLFAWPGIGRQLVTSTFSRDYNVVQAIVFMITIVVVLSFLFVDIAYRWVDPRIQYD